jgi:HlyD family secretion protein
MSFKRQVKPSLGPGGNVFAHSLHHRWARRLVEAALVAGMLWLLWEPILAFFYRGALTAPVKRTDLVISISGDGTIESAHKLDIKNLARGSRNVRQIVPDGSYVRKGDLLVRLDSTLLDEAIAGERAALTKVEAAVLRAQKNWEAARIAVEEYRDGKFVQQQLVLSRDILLAKQGLANAEHSLMNVQIMHRMGFISRAHVDAMELAAEKAEGELASAKTKKDVLEQFTRAKVLADLSSKRDSAAAQLKSDEAILQRAAAKITRLEQDVQNCAIFASQDGMVIYASGPATRNQPAYQVDQGATLRQYQTVLHLVDPDQLQVRMLVAQSKLGQLQRGQRAQFKVLGEMLPGHVASIADRPEPSTPGSGNLKQHAVVIAFDGGREGLKPGMSAQVEIFIQHKKDTLVIPLLCLIDDGAEPRVRVKKRGRVVTRHVVLGIANDASVEVVGGLNEGEQVLFNRPM